MAFSIRSTEITPTTILPSSYETASVRAAPIDPDKVKRDAEVRLRKIKEARNQNASFTG